ncbi:hypothetical protein QCI77_29335 [Bacillus cereus group sp. MG9]|uniref:hypothetical protein n=1 Tax=Bacillus cereus group sp. MG9 TaxID=3040247 RepID=UPI003395B89E
MRELHLFFKALNEELNGEQMEVGDEFVYTCNNATVIYSMKYDENKNKTLDIRVIGGKAIHIDTALPIFTE